MYGWVISGRRVGYPQARTLLIWGSQKQRESTYRHTHIHGDELGGQSVVLDIKNGDEKVGTGIRLPRET